MPLDKETKSNHPEMSVISQVLNIYLIYKAYSVMETPAGNNLVIIKLNIFVNSPAKPNFYLKVS